MKTQPVPETEPDQEAVKHIYNEKMARIRREYLMNQVFPNLTKK